MKKLIMSSALLFGVLACARNANQSLADETKEVKVNAKLADFLQNATQDYKKLAKESSLAWFVASTTGTDAAFADSKQKEQALLMWQSDAQRFAQVQAFRKQGPSGDKLLDRQLEVLYLDMLGKQVKPELLKKINGIEKDVEQTFNTYRGHIDGQEVSQNDIEKILVESTDSAKLKAAWEAQKGVGTAVEKNLLQVVKLRNQVAKDLGFRDYYALRIAENEQDETQLLALFDQLNELTRAPFLKVKAEVDRRLAKRLGVPVDKLMPWHYQNPFFQEPPEVFATGLDAIYKKQDTLALCKKFYSGLGLDVDGIIARSDLYEKEGKSPHAFSIDIDREGDIRVLANIVPGQQWQSTMIHELGHSVYDEYIDHKLPWLLRSASHALTTEGLAMMLDRLVGNPLWAEKLGAMTTEQAQKSMPEARLQQAFASLQFSRWTQVMLRFEREMYANPDQNLNKLWWDLVEKYQGLKRPEGRNAPDYASKIHLVIVPVYYHNYMMGELFGAQVHEEIAKLQGLAPEDTVYMGDPKVGKFLRDKLFAPGDLYRWDELTRRITGHDLGAEAFARRFDKLVENL